MAWLYKIIVQYLAYYILYNSAFFQINIDGEDDNDDRCSNKASVWAHWCCSSAVVGDGNDVGGGDGRDKGGVVGDDVEEKWKGMWWVFIYMYIRRAFITRVAAKSTRTGRKHEPPNNPLGIYIRTDTHLRTRNVPSPYY